MIPFSELTHKWRSTANEWKDNAEHGDRPQAVQAIYEEMAGVKECCADELDAAVHEWRNRVLTIKQAAVESGYCEEALRRAIRNGRISNAGRKNAPRIRRGDLPKKLS